LVPQVGVGALEHRADVRINPLVQRAHRFAIRVRFGSSRQHTVEQMGELGPALALFAREGLASDNNQPITSSADFFALDNKLAAPCTASICSFAGSGDTEAILGLLQPNIVDSLDI
jgi:hypothetical protein